MTLRVYLTGRLCLEDGARVIDERCLPGRQARLVLAYLVAERGHTIDRGELAAVLWPDGPPPAWDAALSAVVSHLRRALGTTRSAATVTIEQAFGCYQLRLPRGAWVDIEAAAHAAEMAEAALRAGDLATAYGWAGVATAVPRRRFLPGATGPWVASWRARLRGLLVRGLDCFADIFVWNGEVRLAVAAAEEAVRLEPMREAGYQALMRAHAAAGDRAGALLAYQRCCALLRDRLGLDPSPATEAVYLALLSP